MKVAVIGAGGRMGQEVARAVHEADDLELVAVIDPFHVGESAGGRTISAAVADLVPRVPKWSLISRWPKRPGRTSASMPKAGSTRWSAPPGSAKPIWRRLPQRFAASKANAIVAANFAIGAVLLMRFCELAAPHMDGVEVIELHHDANATLRRGRRCTRPKGLPTPGRRPEWVRLPLTRPPSMCSPAPAAARVLVGSASIRSDCPDLSRTKKSSSVRLARA